MSKYIGARYMPKFVGVYDATQAYEALSVVDNGSGTSYVSNQPVPAGTPLTDTTYWAVYGSTNGAILNLQQQITALANNMAVIKNVREYGAVGDGITDDTAAINAALSGGGYIIFESGKTYMVDTDVALLPDNDTVLNLNGATIKAIPNSSDHYEIIMVKNKKHVRIYDGIIIGDRYDHLTATGEWGMGIYCYGSEDVIISGCYIERCWGDGIYIGEVCSNINVLNNTIDDCRRQGISITQADNVNISRNLITNINGTAPQGGIDIEPNQNMTVEKCIISENIIIDCEGYGIALSASQSGAKVTDITIDANIIELTTATHVGDCLMIAGATFVVVSNNNLVNKGARKGLVQFSNSPSNIKIIGNYFHDSICSIAISAGCRDLVFENNTLESIDCTTECIYLLSSREVIKGNHFRNITTGNSDYVIYIASAGQGDNKIIDNVMEGLTTQYAIAIGGTDGRNVIKGNVISGTYEYIVYRRGSSTYGNDVVFNHCQGGTVGNFGQISGSFVGLVAQNVVDHALIA